MIDSTQLRSGKGTRDENFPVASRLIRKRHRPVIHAFYEFIRTADDIADHPTLGSAEKLARLDHLEAAILGKGDEPVGIALLIMLNRCGLTAQHAQDLLSAFRQDVIKHRYADWDELIDYCSRSAMPVGRFVLDVHGESRASWPASDALCAALQIINHLQDCKTDYRKLDRVYIPLDALAARSIGVKALADDHSGPVLKECLRALAARTNDLLQESASLPSSVDDRRLAIEISIIQSFARRLLVILQQRDPLSERVHLTKPEMLAMMALGGVRGLLRERFRPPRPAQRYQTP